MNNVVDMKGDPWTPTVVGLDGKPLSLPRPSPGDDLDMMLLDETLTTVMVIGWSEPEGFHIASNGLSDEQAAKLLESCREELLKEAEDGGRTNS